VSDFPDLIELCDRLIRADPRRNKKKPLDHPDNLIPILSVLEALVPRLFQLQLAGVAEEDRANFQQYRQQLADLATAKSVSGKILTSQRKSKKSFSVQRHLSILPSFERPHGT